MNGNDASTANPPSPKRVILAVHGGAGIILRPNLTAELEQQYRTALKEALVAGFAKLTCAPNASDGPYAPYATDPTSKPANTGKNPAVDAVEAAVRVMEDISLFNAGRGSVFGHDGKIRMDASIMACHLDLLGKKDNASTDGTTANSSNNTTATTTNTTTNKNSNFLNPHQIIQKRRYPPRPHPRAGSIAGVSNIKNPISLARAVMERTCHVMLLGRGAEDFARTLLPSVPLTTEKGNEKSVEKGGSNESNWHHEDDVSVEFRPDEYFWTERRWKQLMSVQESEKRHQQQQKQQYQQLRQHQNEKNQNIMKVQLDHSLDPVDPIVKNQAMGKHDSNHDSKNDSEGSNNQTNESSEINPPSKDDIDGRKFGTVGCVALYLPNYSLQIDHQVQNAHQTQQAQQTQQNQKPQRAQLAAATSTGGMTNQRHHRVGDSPLIGSGTYANDLCAVSCTGHGEWFIRCCAGVDVARRLEYKYGYNGSGGKYGDRGDCVANADAARSVEQEQGEALKKAVDEVVFGSLMGDREESLDELGHADNTDSGGDGGIIALDRYGNFAADMNCPGMFHGWMYEDGEIVTRIFWNEAVKQREQ